MIDSRNKISFFTSFNPKNYGQQYKTWRKYSHIIYAIQDPKDTKIDVDCSIILNKAVDIEDRRLHKISDIVKIARILEGSEKFVILNSDIELNFSDQNWNKICQLGNEGLVAGYRLDYKNDRKNLEKNKYGIDFFMINNKIKFNDASLFMGSCAWDWWVVHLCMSQNVPVYSTSKDIYHKVHERNWSDEMFVNSQFWFEKATNVNKESIKKQLISYIKDVDEIS